MDGNNVFELNNGGGLVKMPDAAQGITNPVEQPLSNEPTGIFAPIMTGDINKDIDRITTTAALRNEEQREKLIDEKANELTAIAEAKRIDAEAIKQAAEAKKRHQEVQHSANILDAESSELEKKASKAKAFFNANKAVLRIIGIREPLGFRTMTIFYLIALPLYILFSIGISFPISVIEYLVDIVIDTIGKISKKVTTTFLRVTAGICSIGLSGGIVTGIYLIITKLLI